MRSARRTKTARSLSPTAVSCVRAKMAATPALHSVLKSFVHRRVPTVVTLSWSPSAIDVVANGSAHIRTVYLDPTIISVGFTCFTNISIDKLLALLHSLFYFVVNVSIYRNPPYPMSFFLSYLHFCQCDGIDRTSSNYRFDRLLKGVIKHLVIRQTTETV